MTGLRPDDPLAQEVVQAIKHESGDALRALLDEHPGLAARRLVGGSSSAWDGRTLLHAVTDWPGHVPDGGAKVIALAAAGADVDAPFGGPGTARRRCIGRRAATTSRRSTRCWTRARRSTRRARRDRRRHRRSTTRSPSGSGRRRAGCVERGARVQPVERRGARAPGSRPRAACQNAPPPSGRRADERPSGAPATAASAPPRSTCSSAAPTATGSATTTSPPLDAARRSGAIELADWLAAEGARSAADVRGD